MFRKQRLGILGSNDLLFNYMHYYNRNGHYTTLVSMLTMLAMIYLCYGNVLLVFVREI